MIVVVWVVVPVVQPDPEDGGGRDAWGDWVTFSPSQITAHDDALFRVRRARATREPVGWFSCARSA